MSGLDSGLDTTQLSLGDELKHFTRTTTKSKPQQKPRRTDGNHNGKGIDMNYREAPASPPPVDDFNFDLPPVSPPSPGKNKYNGDRIQNDLLDEICSDIGIKDSMELDLYDFDMSPDQPGEFPALYEEGDDLDQTIPFGQLVHGGDGSQPTQTSSQASGGYQSSVRSDKPTPMRSACGEIYGSPYPQDPKPTTTSAIQPKASYHYSNQRHFNSPMGSPLMGIAGDSGGSRSDLATSPGSKSIGSPYMNQQPLSVGSTVSLHSASPQGSPRPAGGMPKVASNNSILARKGSVDSINSMTSMQGSVQPPSSQCSGSMKGSVDSLDNVPGSPLATSLSTPFPSLGSPRAHRSSIQTASCPNSPSVKRYPTASNKPLAFASSPDVSASGRPHDPLKQLENLVSKDIKSEATGLQNPSEDTHGQSALTHDGFKVPGRPPSASLVRSATPTLPSSQPLSAAPSATCQPQRPPFQDDLPQHNAYRRSLSSPVDPGYYSVGTNSIKNGSLAGNSSHYGSNSSLNTAASSEHSIRDVKAHLNICGPNNTEPEKETDLHGNFLVEQVRHQYKPENYRKAMQEYSQLQTSSTGYQFSQPQVQDGRVQIPQFTQQEGCVPQFHGQGIPNPTPQLVLNQGMCGGQREASPGLSRPPSQGMVSPGLYQQQNLTSPSLQQRAPCPSGMTSPGVHQPPGQSGMSSQHQPPGSPHMTLQHQHHRQSGPYYGSHGQHGTGHMPQHHSPQKILPGPTHMAGRAEYNPYPRVPPTQNQFGNSRHCASIDPYDRVLEPTPEVPKGNVYTHGRGQYNMGGGESACSSGPTSPSHKKQCMSYSGPPSPKQNQRPHTVYNQSAYSSQNNSYGNNLPNRTPQMPPTATQFVNPAMRGAMPHTMNPSMSQNPHMGGPRLPHPGMSSPQGAMHHQLVSNPSTEYSGMSASQQEPVVGHVMPSQPISSVHNPMQQHGTPSSPQVPMPQSPMQPQGAMSNMQQHGMPQADSMLQPGMPPGSMSMGGAMPHQRMSQGSMSLNGIPQGSMPHRGMSPGSIPHPGMHQGNLSHTAVSQGSIPHNRMSQGSMPHSRMSQGSMSHMAQGSMSHPGMSQGSIPHTRMPHIGMSQESMPHPPGMQEGAIPGMSNLPVMPSDEQPSKQASFVHGLVTTGSPAFRSHPFFPLLRDLIIADMNFHSPTFPFALIANLPMEFDKLLQNFLQRNPARQERQCTNPAIENVVMDALKHAHSALIEKILARKGKEGIDINKGANNPIEDFCERFDRAVRNSMGGPATGIPPSPGLPNQQGMMANIPGDEFMRPHQRGPPHPSYLPPANKTFHPVGMYGGSRSAPSTPMKPMWPPRMTEFSDVVSEVGYVGMKSSVSDVPDKPPSKKQVLPKEAVAIMMDWLREHQDNPYPNDDEKEMLIGQTKLTINQINYWFTNARRRILPKWALQKYMKEQQEQKEKTAGIVPSSSVAT